MVTINVPLQRPIRRPVGQTLTSIDGTVGGFLVTITLTNDELHIQPHHDGLAASVNMMDLARAMVGELMRPPAKVREGRS